MTHSLGTTAMNFGQALALMKRGFRVARAGWNGKDMWIAYNEGRDELYHQSFWNKHAKEVARKQPNGCAKVLPYFLMKTADNAILIGWLASQTDLAAEDWFVLEETDTPIPYDLTA